MNLEMARQWVAFGRRVTRTMQGGDESMQEFIKGHKDHILIVIEALQHAVNFADGKMSTPQFLGRLLDAWEKIQQVGKAG